MQQYGAVVGVAAGCALALPRCLCMRWVGLCTPGVGVALGRKRHVCLVEGARWHLPAAVTILDAEHVHAFSAPQAL